MSRLGISRSLSLGYIGISTLKYVVWLVQNQAFYISISRLPYPCGTTLGLKGAVLFLPSIGSTIQFS